MQLYATSTHLSDLSLSLPKAMIERGDGEGAPIRMPTIRLGTAENHRTYYLLPSDNFIVKKSGPHAKIEPTTFWVLTHAGCNH